MRASLLALLAPLMASALVAPSARTAPRTVARMLPPPGGPMSPEQMKQAADAMKNLTPEQIEMMLGEVENMGPAEKARRPRRSLSRARLRARARARPSRRAWPAMKKASSLF